MVVSRVALGEVGSTELCMCVCVCGGETWGEGGESCVCMRMCSTDINMHTACSCDTVYSHPPTE